MTPQNLIPMLSVIALPLAAVAVWRSTRRWRAILIILAWWIGCFAVGTWFEASLGGRGAGRTPLVLALAGAIAASAGQLTRHGKERRRPVSPASQTAQNAGGAQDERQPRQDKFRRGNQRTTWNWARVAELWRDLPDKTSTVLIACTIVAGLVAIVAIRYPWTTRPAPPAPAAPAVESSRLPGVMESWSYHTGLPWRGNADSFHTPAVGSDGTVYAAGDNELLAFSPAGDLKWRRSGFGAPLAVLIADDGAVWSGTQTGWLVRTTVAGEADPQFGGPGFINQLALSPGSVLLACGRNMSSTISTARYPKDRRDISNSIGPNLGPMKGAAFSANGAFTIEENNLTSWPLGFGQPNWQTKVGWGCHHPAIAKDGTIYLACSDELVAINADGSTKWSFPTKFPTPAVIGEDGTVFFAGILDGTVYSLHPDGRLRWTFPVGKPVVSTPAISSSGVIYVGSQSGYLYALDPSGTPLWALKTQGEVYSPTISPDGMIYVQSADGMLHAIAQPQNGGLAGQWPKLDADQSNTSHAQ